MDLATKLIALAFVLTGCALDRSYICTAKCTECTDVELKCGDHIGTTQLEEEIKDEIDSLKTNRARDGLRGELPSAETLPGSGESTDEHN